MAAPAQGPARISIGEVLGPHGHRGQVRVRPLTDFPERFGALESVELYWPRTRRSRRLAVVEAHVDPRGRVVLAFAGVDSVEAAEELRGAWLRVPRSEAVRLPPGHYFVFDIVGLRVVTVDGRELGVVEDVLQTGANDVYVVRRDGAAPLLLPATREVVEEIDLPGARMVVRLLPGLE